MLKTTQDDVPLPKDDQEEEQEEEEEAGKTTGAGPSHGRSLTMWRKRSAELSAKLNSIHLQASFQSKFFFTSCLVPSCRGVQVEQHVHAEYRFLNAGCRATC